MANKVVENHVPQRVPLRRVVDGWGLLIVPSVLFLAVAFVLPIGIMIVRSLTDPSPANYREFFQSDVHLQSLIYTLFIAFCVVLFCIAVGYPWAYLMAHAGPRMRILLVALVLIPFWTSALVRTYAWTVLLRPSGVVNQMLLKLGLIDEPLKLMNNTFGAMLGMTQIMLPLIVLPLYAAMARIDGDLVRAGRGLGATPWSAFRKIFFPLTLPGLFAGSLLVFVLTLGFYITPALLGGHRNPMFSQIVVQENNELLHTGYASALGVILLAVTLIVVWLGGRIVRIGDVFGFGGGDPR